MQEQLGSVASPTFRVWQKTSAEFDLVERNVLAMHLGYLLTVCAHATVGAAACSSKGIEDVAPFNSALNLSLSAFRQATSRQLDDSNGFQFQHVASSPMTEVLYTCSVPFPSLLIDHTHQACDS